MQKLYKSKIGLEIVIPLILLFGFLIYLNIVKGVNWKMFIILFLNIIFIVHMFASTNYKIDGNNLIVTCGFLFNATIDIDTITSIAETNNILSSPAASFDRLEIVYGKNEKIMISPKLKKEFINNIITINPNIQIKWKKV